MTRWRCLRWIFWWRSLQDADFHGFPCLSCIFVPIVPDGDQVPAPFPLAGGAGGFGVAGAYGAVDSGFGHFEALSKLFRSVCPGYDRPGGYVGAPLGLIRS